MFFLLAVGYAMRVNLSVGIVAMTTANSSSNPDIPYYNWDNKSFILSTFFMGYVCLQVIAGEFGKRYGPKWFLVGSMIMNSAACMMIPFMASKFDYGGVIACRVVQGLFQGFFFPSVHNILGKWAPPSERATLGNIVFTGVAFGTIFAILITGTISASWAGWPAAFYFFGSLGLGWCIVWILLGANTPSDHKSISAEEKFYIESSLQDDLHKKVPKTPWKEILTSMPVWAIVVANFGQNWGYATLLTEISNYLNKVCNQDISQNSLLSAAPYTALFLLGLAFGPIADWLVAKKYLSPANTRKLMNTIGTLVPALALAILGFIPKENIAVIECLLVIAVGVNAAVWCGFQVNHVDLSPKFSGILMGIGNGSSNIFSIISPNIVQAIVTDETDPAQWRTVFLIASAIYILSDIFFVIFAKADRQWWDNLGGDTTEVEDQFQEIKLEKES
ncbi:putative inorganic phosphate cotransporter isoform X2 [Rhynchophorus ferrugineus]